MATIKFDASGPLFAGGSGADDFDIAVEEFLVGATETLQVVTDRDITYETVTIIAPKREFRVSIINRNLNADQPALENLTPAVCALDEAGYASYLSDGIAVIRASNQYGARELRRDMTPGPNLVTSKIVNFTPGSLSKYLNDRALNYVAGLVPSDATTQVYSGSVFAGNITLNNGRIAPDIDLSWLEVSHGVSPTQQVYEQGPCSLITPRHALLAFHYRPNIGDYSTFRRSDGTLQTVRILRIDSLSRDVGLMYFDAPVTGCDFVKLLPTPTLGALSPRLYEDIEYGVPLYNIKSGLDVFIAPWNSMDSQSLAARRKLMMMRLSGTYVATPGRMMRLSAPPEVQLAPWWPRAIRGGDSGSPVFLPIVEPGNTAPTCVLLTQLWYANAGPELGEFIGAINDTMNANRSTGDTTTYAVGIVDTSAFATYN